jgi:hypothetical protein
MINAEVLAVEVRQLLGDDKQMVLVQRLLGMTEVARDVKHQSGQTDRDTFLSRYNRGASDLLTGILDTAQASGRASRRLQIAIHRARTHMRRADVFIHLHEIPAEHLRVGMTHQRLQGKDVDTTCTPPWICVSASCSMKRRIKSGVSWEIWVTAYASQNDMKYFSFFR